MGKNVKYDQMVEWLKDCGKSIIDNAETIVGGYQYQTGDLDVMITLNDTDAPTISVNQQFVPEMLVERARRRNHEQRSEGDRQGHQGPDEGTETDPKDHGVLG